MGQHISTIMGERCEKGWDGGTYTTMYMNLLGKSMSRPPVRRGTGWGGALALRPV